MKRDSQDAGAFVASRLILLDKKIDLRPTGIGKALTKSIKNHK